MAGIVQHPLVNQIQLAGIMGVSTDTIRSWERAGCPVESPGRKGVPSQYRASEVIAWDRERAVRAATGDLAAADLNELRRRKLAAEVVLVELTLAEKQEKLMDLDVVVEQFTDACLSIRGRFLALPAALVPRLLLARTQQEFFKIVQEAVYEALEDLSSGDFPLFRDQGVAASPLGIKEAGHGV